MMAIEVREVVQRQDDIGMVGAEPLLRHRQRALGNGNGLPVPGSLVELDDLAVKPV